MAMVTGGFLPAELRGTKNFAQMHVADWYPTLCNLVGVDPTDTVSIMGAPRPIDGYVSTEHPPPPVPCLPCPALP
jgi:arylsulfatase A-like enzyme